MVNIGASIDNQQDLFTTDETTPGASTPSGIPPREMTPSRSQISFLEKGKQFLFDVKSFLFVLPKVLGRRHKRDFALPNFLAHEEAPTDHFGRFIKQSVAAGAALLFITSIAPSGLREAGVSADYIDNESGFLINSETLPQDYLIPTSDDGYFLKMNPQEGEVERIGFTDKVKHVVESGETLSQIADRYHVGVDTLVWENKLDKKDRLSIGQTLVIPPVDGITYVVSGNETLGKIAKKFKVEEEVIKTHNQLASNSISKGQTLFIPGAKPPKEVSRVVAREGSRNGRLVTVEDTFEPRAPSISSNEKPDEGKMYIFPTVGSITRGFGGGHYGIDIGNREKPDVWAAATGTVVKARGGCPDRDEEKILTCNGGYGNHVIVDHGNGMQTLYGHMETLYVTEGQQLEQGQLIGKMGSSGRVFGPTGIHLHWECIVKGVKRSCNPYF